MNPPPAAEAENTPQDALAASVTDELVLLALEHSAPVTCACGASWDLERALGAVGRAVASENHPSE